MCVFYAVHANHDRAFGQEPAKAEVLTDSICGFQQTSVANLFDRSQSPHAPRACSAQHAYHRVHRQQHKLLRCQRIACLPDHSMLLSCCVSR